MPDNRSYNQIERDHFEHDSEFLLLNMKTVSDEDGEVILLVCEKCPYIATTYCMHKKNSWNEEGTQLTCDLCGIDGT